LTWSAAFNIHAAIDLKARVQEGTRVSIDSEVRKVSNGTPASIMASTVECAKRTLSFRIILF
jgi:hypothetical protein